MVPTASSCPTPVGATRICWSAPRSGPRVPLRPDLEGKPGRTPAGSSPRVAWRTRSTTRPPRALWLRRRSGCRTHSQSLGPARATSPDRDADPSRRRETSSGRDGSRPFGIAPAFPGKREPSAALQTGPFPARASRRRQEKTHRKPGCSSPSFPAERNAQQGPDVRRVAVCLERRRDVVASGLIKVVPRQLFLQLEVASQSKHAFAPHSARHALKHGYAPAAVST